MLKVYKLLDVQYEKKLTRLLFDFGVVNTTDDNCEQQIQSVALRLQQLTMHTGGETTVVLVARASFRR